MKTVLFQVSGEPAPLDLAVMAYTTPRGGMSSAIYKCHGYSERAELRDGEPVKVSTPAETPEEMALALAGAINDSKGEFCPGEFQASTKGDLLILTCSDLVEDAMFLPQVQGKGTAKIEEL